MSNGISGSMPSTIANITRLRSLDLSKNFLTGVFPLSTLTMLTALT